MKKKAISSFALDKISGLNSIILIFLQNIQDRISGSFGNIFRPCVAYDYKPMSWKIVGVAIIPKLGKVTYLVAKSCRPIRLMSFVLKTLKRLIEWHI